MASQKIIERWRLTLKRMSEEVVLVSNEEKRKAYRRFVTRIHGAQGLKLTPILARGMEIAPIHQDDLDRAVGHLPCRNGVLDLRSLELLP